MNPQWKPYLQEETQKPYFLALRAFLKQRKEAGKSIYPPNVYSAFEMAPQDVRVIILGQDPYHGAHQAHGLSFSVLPGIAPPPSLQNIYQEIESEYHFKMDRNNGYLLPWAQQGVFLLNSVLSVEAHKPSSHKGMGWETFTDKVIEVLSETQRHLVFMLWGKYAQAKSSLIAADKHLVLQSAHPSPYAANQGFFGNNHFLKANAYLVAHGFKEIDWKI